MERRALVTGAAGYLGARACLELIAAGWRVRGLDALLHGQETVAAELERLGVDLIIADLCDPDVHARALAGVEDVVHLGAIVGDPACARDPKLAHAVNVAASRKFIEAARRAGVGRLVFASTCSNYGRSAEPDVFVDETAPLAPVSLYARQKVQIETELLDGSARPTTVTSLRFATLFGVAPRMRFDLTVNEFTRDLWADRHLEVFGGQFWRPYVHVKDAARAIRLALESRSCGGVDAVFNVGGTDQNYRKREIVQLIRQVIDTGTVDCVERIEDPRDYRVSFEQIERALAFTPRMTVSDGIGEVVAALSDGRFRDPFDACLRNSP